MSARRLWRWPAIDKTLCDPTSKLWRSWTYGWHTNHARNQSSSVRPRTSTLWMRTGTWDEQRRNIIHVARKYLVFFVTLLISLSTTKGVFNPFLIRFISRYIAVIGNEMGFQILRSAHIRSRIKQIWVIFDRLKLWIAVARPNLKWWKFKLFKLAFWGLMLSQLLNPILKQSWLDVWCWFINHLYDDHHIITWPWQWLWRQKGIRSKWLPIGVSQCNRELGLHLFVLVSTKRYKNGKMVKTGLWNYCLYVRRWDRLSFYSELKSLLLENILSVLTFW